MVPVTEQRSSLAGKVTVGLASHWPCITDFSGMCVDSVSYGGDDGAVRNWHKFGELPSSNPTVYETRTCTAVDVDQYSGYFRYVRWGTALRDGGDDGARLRDDRRDQSLLIRLYGRSQPGRQDLSVRPSVCSIYCGTLIGNREPSWPSRS